MSDGVGIEQVEDAKAQALRELDSASDEASLERWRIAYLGRGGEMTRVLRGLGSLPPEDRRAEYPLIRART